MAVMSDLEELYSPSSRAGGSADPYIADWQARSQAARTSLGDRVVCLAGGTLVVDAGRRAPVLVFVHGGYWQALSAAESLFLAQPLLALGWSFAAVEYTIAPAGTLPQMAGECRDALRCVAAALPDAGPVVLAGHSAGAHLAAMVAVVAESPVPLHRLVLVSGVFDLRPLCHTSVNDPLGLDEDAAAAVSPQLLGVASRRSTVVAWGDHDTDAFAAQSRAYAGRLRDGGVPAVELECAGRHHFDIVDDLAAPGSPLGGLTLAR
jgi:arylformamidase